MISIRAIVAFSAIASVNVFTGYISAASSLEENSPFLPPGYTPPSTAAPKMNNAQPVAVRNIKFKGVYQLSGSFRFNLYDEQKQQGVWHQLNAEQEGIEILEFIPDSNEIRVQIGSETATLQLDSAPEPSNRIAARPPPTPARRTTVPGSNPNLSPRPRRPVIRPPQPGVSPRERAEEIRRQRRPTVTPNTQPNG